MLNKWCSSKGCYHFVFICHTLQVISTQDRRAKPLSRFNWNVPSSMDPFLNFPRWKWLLRSLRQHTPCIGHRGTQDILSTFLFVICNLLTFTFVYMFIFPPSPKFLETTNHVLLLHTQDQAHSKRYYPKTTTSHQFMRLAYRLKYLETFRAIWQ